jgi:hypothetical protein
MCVSGHKAVRFNPPRGRTHRQDPGWLPGSAIAVTILSSVLLFLAASRGLALGKQYEVREVAPEIFVWIPEDIMDQHGDPRFSRAGNVGFIVTNQGVVVVDTTNNPFHAREVLYEVRERTSIPVMLTIDASAAGDEMLGNEVFAEQRSTILSTTAAAQEMRLYQQELARRMPVEPELPFHMRGVHFTLPTETFNGEMSFTMGGQRIQVISLPCAPHGGAAAVFFPQEKVAFLGNLYVNGYVPRIGSRDIHRWIGVLGQVEKWDADIYVPAHGDPGNKASLEQFRGLLEWLQGRVQGEIRQGKSLLQIERELLGSNVLYLRARELAPATIAAVYRQLVPHPRRAAAHLTSIRSAASRLQPHPSSTPLSSARQTLTGGHEQ